MNGIEQSSEKKMDITFFIGNGFDKALGLKTGYQDFYAWLKEQPPSENPFIEKMKNDIFSHYENWSDFEAGLGKFVNIFKNRELAQHLYLWKIATKETLSQYLISQMTADTVSNILKSNQNIQRCLEFLHSFLFSQRLLNPIFFSFDDEKIVLHLISLNYTDSLDQIVKGLSEYESSLVIDSNVSHPHGTLTSGIVIGVNDKTQIENEEIKKLDSFSFLLEKREIIELEENQICKQAKIKSISDIKTSAIVCLYGVSLGETDKDWWNEIGLWLQNKKHRLIIFWYNTTIPTLSQDNIKEKFISLLNISDTAKEELKERIIVYLHSRGELFLPVPKKKIQKQSQMIFSLDNGIELSMILVEAGSFTMSMKDGNNDSKDIEYTAVLTKDYYIGETPVTQGQWKAVMGNNPSKSKGDKRPVEQVTWHDAMRFCVKLNSMVNLPADYHFTLPTEIQWEYAARGGKKSKGYKYSGSNDVDEVSWHENNSGNKTHEVGQKTPNELGIYDMSGNVWEWCLDDEEKDRSKNGEEFSIENDDSHSRRADRGGAYDCSTMYSCVASRSHFNPSEKCHSIGFRVVLVPEHY